MIFYQFAIAAAVSIALNLAVAALTKTDEKDETKALLKSSFGFPLEKPFGTVRLRSRNVFWGLPIEDEESGGGKGGNRGSGNSYATFAVMGGWGEIERVSKIYLDSELFFEYDGTNFTGAMQKARKRKGFDSVDIYYGTSGQNPCATIEKHEGVGNVPAFLGRFYLVFDRLEIRPGGSYPTVDIEVVSREKTLIETLSWACKQNLTVQQIEIDPTLNKYSEVNIDFAQDGGTIADFIQELQRVHFFFTIDTGDKIIFRDFDTPTTQPIVDLTLNNLGCSENNQEAIARYMQTIPDVLELPSELQFEYVSLEQNYDLGFQPAFRHDAQHQNEINIRVRQVLKDTEASNIAWRSLGIVWTQSRKLEQLSLLPSVGKNLQLGGLFTVPIEGIKHTFQLETKEIGDNDLVEISAVSYDKIEPNFILNNPTFPNAAAPEIPTGNAIALDIPLIQDSDTDIGIYVGVTSTENWKYGTIFVSDNNGNSYGKLTDFTGKSTVGTVLEWVAPGGNPQDRAHSLTQIPQPNNPDIIDYGSEMIIHIPNGGIIESITEEDFLNLKQMGLFGNEIIAWQNAELTAPNTFKLTKLLRGLRGTERLINQHSTGEQFVLLKGTGARLIRVAGRGIEDLGKTLLFKAVHGGQSLDSIQNETSLTVTGEALKPYSPVNPEILHDTATDDLIISWTLRTRRYGAWRNGGDIIHSDTNQSILEILANDGTVVHTTEIFDYTEPSYTFTAAQQIQYIGSLQSELSFNIYQVSQFVGRGVPLEVRNKVASSR